MFLKVMLTCMRSPSGGFKPVPASMKSMQRRAFEKAASGGRLEESLSLATRQDAEHLPVFRDGASRDVDVLGAEDLDDLLVAVRLVARLLGDDLLDLVLHRFAGDVVAAHARDGRVEEELQLVDPLRRV